MPVKITKKSQKKDYEQWYKEQYDLIQTADKNLTFFLERAKKLEAGTALFLMTDIDRVLKNVKILKKLFKEARPEALSETQLKEAYREANLKALSTMNSDIKNSMPIIEKQLIEKENVQKIAELARLLAEKIAANNKQVPPKSPTYQKPMLTTFNVESSKPSDSPKSTKKKWSLFKRKDKS